MNEHNFTLAKLKDLCEQSFELTIEDRRPVRNYDIPHSLSHTHQKMPMNILLYRLLLLKQKKISFKEMKIEMRQDKRWSRIQSKVEDHLNNIMKLS